MLPNWAVTYFFLVFTSGHTIRGFLFSVSRAIAKLLVFPFRSGSIIDARGSPAVVVLRPTTTPNNLLTEII